MTTSKFKVHQFGKYLLLDEVASGGMAIVYKALGKTIDGKNHYFAIKRILPHYTEDEEFISLIKDEAKIMVQMNHPNIVSLIEFGKVDDDYYIAMEYIEGTTLKGLIQRVISMGGSFSIDMAIHIVREVAFGLAYAHRKTNEQGNPLEIVHRDISPANILVSFQGEVKITDFGISKASTQTHFTQTGIIRGKTGYMSPEQTRSDNLIDHRSDLFSLGAIFYELLTGHKLFYAKSIPEAIRLVREGNIPPLSNYRDDIPPELEKIVLKILAQKPEYRYQRGEDFTDALNEFLTVFSPAGRPLRITHVDLIGFMKRFYPTEMSGGAVENSSPRLDMSGKNIPSNSKILEQASRGRTIVTNQLFELSTPGRSQVNIEQSVSIAEAIEGEVSFGRKKPIEVTEVSRKTNIPRRFSKWVAVASVAVLLIVIGTKLPKYFQNGIRTVSIESEPSGAEIWIDSVLQEQKTPAKFRVSEKKSSIQIKIQKDGYQKIEQSQALDEMNKTVFFQLQAEEIEQVEQAPEKKVIDKSKSVDKKVVQIPEKKTTTLPKKKTTILDPVPLGQPGKKVVGSGNLSVASNPWSYVFLDGKKIGETPVIGFSTTSGKHSLKLSNPTLKLKEKKTNINVQANKQIKCSYEFSTDKLECF